MNSLNRLMSRVFCVLVCLALLPACAASESAAEGEAAAMASDLADENDKTLYALGLAIAQQLGGFGLDETELGVVKQGLADGVLKREAKVDLQEYGPKIQAMAQERAAAVAQVEADAGVAFLDEMASADGATRTASGIVIQEITAGTGDSPEASDSVTVHYHGTLRDGTVFDSSVDRGQPATFPLTGVIPCWTEGVQTMKVGGKVRLGCPADLAYGAQGRPGIPGGAALVFEVELISIGGE